MFDFRQLHCTNSEDFFSDNSGILKNLFVVHRSLPVSSSRSHFFVSASDYSLIHVMLTYKHSNKKNDLDDIYSSKQFSRSKHFSNRLHGTIKYIKRILKFYRKRKIKDYSLYQNANYDTLSSIFGLMCFYFIRYFPTYILVLLVILVRYFEKQFEIF